MEASKIFSSGILFDPKTVKSRMKGGIYSVKPHSIFRNIFLHLIYNFFSILYILPPSGKRNCAIPGIAGEEHTDHTSHKYFASTKQNMLDGYSVAAEMKNSNVW